MSLGCLHAEEVSKKFIDFVSVVDKCMDIKVQFNYNSIINIISAVRFSKDATLQEELSCLAEVINHNYLQYFEREKQKTIRIII